MKNITVAILLILVIGFGALAFNKNKELVALLNQNSVQQPVPTLQENPPQDIPSNNLAQPATQTNCDLAHAFAKTLGSGRYIGYAYCGSELLKPFKTSVGTFVIKTKTMETSAPFPNAPKETVSVDSLYFISPSGEIEVPLNYDRSYGGIDVPKIASVIDLSDRVIMIQLQHAVSFVGIDLVKGSNSVPISVSGADVVDGRTR